MSSPARVTVVIATRNRRDELLRTLGRLTALPNSRLAASPLREGGGAAVLGFLACAWPGPGRRVVDELGRARGRAPRGLGCPRPGSAQEPGIRGRLNRDDHVGPAPQLAGPTADVPVRR